MRFVLPLLIILGSFAARSAIGKSRWEPPEGNGYDYLVFNQTKNTVDDGETARLPDAVNMTIKDVNHVPVALAQGDPPVAGRRAAVGAADSTALMKLAIPSRIVGHNSPVPSSGLQSPVWPISVIVTHMKPFSQDLCDRIIVKKVAPRLGMGHRARTVVCHSHAEGERSC